LIKNLHGWHPLLANCLRITVGTPEENDLLLSALTELNASNGSMLERSG
jgi:histidinol-phosphate aminotransferase